MSQPVYDPRQAKPPKPKTHKGPRMAVPAEHEGDPPIYVSQDHYLKITKKVQIERTYTKGRVHFVEYRTKGGNRGVLEFYDLGPK